MASSPQEEQPEQPSEEQQPSPGDEQQPSEQQRQSEEQQQQEDDAFYNFENLFSESESSLWDNLEVSRALEPLTEEEKQKLRSRLPTKLANFLIRRADAAVRLRDTKGGDDSFLGQFLSDLPPDVPDWDNPANAEYRDYVYETTTGPPSFRRQGSSIFGGGDGAPDLKDMPNSEGFVDVTNGVTFPKQVVSLFVGNVDSIDEQAAKVGYTLLALFLVLIVAKIIFALISFFVSFTFSFFSIFALSAGIFVVFYLFKF